VILPVRSTDEGDTDEEQKKQDIVATLVLTHHPSTGVGIG